MHHGNKWHDYKYYLSKYCSCACTHTFPAQLVVCTGIFFSPGTQPLSMQRLLLQMAMTQNIMITRVMITSDIV